MSKEKEVSLLEFERQVFELEGVRIVIRTNRDKITPYDYERKARRNMSVMRFLHTRIGKFLKARESVCVIDGYGNEVPFINTIDNVRKSYNI